MCGRNRFLSAETQPWILLIISLSVRNNESLKLVHWEQYDIGFMHWIDSKWSLKSVILDVTGERNVTFNLRISLN